MPQQRGRGRDCQDDGPPTHMFYENRFLLLRLWLRICWCQCDERPNLQIGSLNLQIGRGDTQSADWLRKGCQSADFFAIAQG